LNHSIPLKTINKGNDNQLKKPQFRRIQEPPKKLSLTDNERFGNNKKTGTA
jgi:hypothetical protein